MSTIEYSVSLNRSTVRRRTPIGVEPEPDWRNSSACVGSDLNLFFPISTAGAAAQSQIAEAKAVCATCPVTRDCLDWALKVGPEFGIFGGHTDAERRLLRQRTNPHARLVNAVLPNPGSQHGETNELN